MQRQAHGGSCCGINHISGMGGYPLREYLRQLDILIAERKQRRKAGVIEIVLTDEQAASWENQLIVRGFRRVNRFWNSNSGNACNIYHLKQGSWFVCSNTEDGCVAAFFGSFMRDLMTFYYVAIATTSIVVIHQSVGLVERLVTFCS